MADSSALLHSHSRPKYQSCLSIVVSSLGLAIDFYDISMIACVKSLLVQQYGAMSDLENSTLSASALVGATVGQLVIGALGDCLGRRAMFITCALLTFFGAALSAAVKSDDASNVYWSLIAYRFVMGFGIGGEYPIAASHTVENVDAERSAQSLATVALSFPLGAIVAPALVWICLSVGASGEFTWRFAFAFGAVASFASFLLRYTKVQNSAAFNDAREKRTCKKSLHMLRRFAKPFIGVSGCWFLYDVITYGLALFSAEISAGASHTSVKDSVFQVLLYSFMAVPGACFAISAIPFFGRKLTLLVSLSIMLILYMVLSVFLDNLPMWLFTVLYGLQLIFDRIGPLPLSFMLPVEIFPTEVRATAHGAAAATGKCGAIVGAYVVGILKSSFGMQAVFSFMCIVTFAEIMWIFVLVPNYNSSTLKHLEDMHNSLSDTQLDELLYGRMSVDVQLQSESWPECKL
mmetsp:Transcript_27897/g.51009  ORF Transcript_27897/g.51009 Transcript_27897/m.51009 type:complete len:462 (-) Transcript_27897:346-1731(-)